GQLGLRVAALLADQVVLVRDDDEPFAFFDDHAGETAVLRGRSRQAVEQQERDVAASDRAERAQRRVVLDRAAGRDFLADAGGVDEPDRVIFVREDSVDRVARRPGNRRNDRAL